VIVAPIKTDRISAGDATLLSLLDKYVQAMTENSVLAITSKIVSLCEGRVVPIGSIDKEELVKRESSYYLPGEFGKYGYHFSIVNNSLTSAGGIDESNGDDNYILWPSDAQQTANEVREYLAKRFNLKNVGVIITDSTCTPLRLGTLGAVISHSGFAAIRNYIGKPDLFNRPFEVSRANVALGLAASAVVVMGEGSEQTPLVMLSDLSFVEFQDRNPSDEELAGLLVSREDDLFAPFFDRVDWLKGDI
jgi:F420-0:gamma-glutamyl ligase